MTKYTRLNRPEFKRPFPTHPIWRGIGCLLIIIVPILSFGASYLIVNNPAGPGFQIPAEVMAPILFPDWVWRTPLLAALAAPISAFPHPIAFLLGGILIMILITGIATTLYAIIYQIAGPKRLTRIDAPPPKGHWRTKKSR